MTQMGVFIYAEDNTVSACDKTITGVISKLAELLYVVMECFTEMWLSSSTCFFLPICIDITAKER